MWDYTDKVMDHFKHPRNVGSIPNADGSETTDYFIVTATYNKVLKPGAFTEISLAQIALDPSATNEAHLSQDLDQRKLAYR